MKRCKSALMLLLLFFSAVSGFAQTDNFSLPSESTITFEDWKLPEEYEQELLIWFAVLALALLLSTGRYLARQRHISPDTAAQLLDRLQPEHERLGQEVAQLEHLRTENRRRKQQLMELTRLCNHLSSNSTR